MNVGKLKRVAIKEFKRSPGKTGFLLVILPVALYFCVPLLVGAFGKSSSSTKASTIATSSKKADFVLPVAAKKTPAKGRGRNGWLEVSRWLDRDSLALPATVAADARNPFVGVGREEKDESLVGVDDDERVEQEDIEQAVENIDGPRVAANPIRELGLQLNATMIGRRTRLATINGKTYEQGETIPVFIETGVGTDKVTKVQLNLTHVDRRFVELQMDVHQHRLRLRNEIPKDAIVVKPRPE
ncbi:MAG: hypothetical protein H8E66_31370 [Planctomycetes bacterium]|nr:hypothetical protein [Planctomycetota bacterium]